MTGQASTLLSYLEDHSFVKIEPSLLVRPLDTGTSRKPPTLLGFCQNDIYCIKAIVLFHYHGEHFKYFLRLPSGYRLTDQHPVNDHWIHFCKICKRHILKRVLSFYLR